MEKSFRVKANISKDTVLNVNMQQDYDFLEVLTMKLRQKDSYKLHSSSYGVVIGRVLANEAFGIPNAKISIFIERDSNDTETIESIYPYYEITSKDNEGRRYNLLPNSHDDDCYMIVGTFPNKRLVLDNDSQLEIYDKYWKYTTVTNNAGDYMLFGVPSGNQQIHVDIDLSDIGILSQKPRDFEYKGYNISMFDNANQFKSSTNLDGLAQLFSQDKSVFVYPFWGARDNEVAAITRCDVQIQYKFEPTCVFMGAIMSDNSGNAIGHNCSPSTNNGMNSQLVSSEGTIEMIRKTPDGYIEEFPIQGNQLIDSDGVWCYQIPMNLDFVGTDEYGNIVPTDNPSKGIPTRTQVRFRFSKAETGNEGFSRHTAKYLVPMNPIFDEEKVIPTVEMSGHEVENMYAFGSSTPQSCFRDLYWNNVYSVKNYIPKVQIASKPYSEEYSALKGSNLVEKQNPVPFNKLRIDMPFMYMIICILFNIVMLVVQIINVIITAVNSLFKIINTIRSIKIPIINVRPFAWIPKISYIGCVSLGGGLSEDNTAYYPSCGKEGMEAADCPEGMAGCKKSASPGALRDRVQQKLARDYKIVKLDFYQDWINGCLYMPLWYWKKTKKKKFLFFTISSAKNEMCGCNGRYSKLKAYTTCNIAYTSNSLDVTQNSVPDNEDSWHRSAKRSSMVKYRQGVIKDVINKDDLTVYYYAALQATADNENPNLALNDRKGNFRAIRLYATDIILLGNLDEDNIYGIPQFFKALPSTTANIPPIATIKESAEDEQVDESQNELASSEESGITTTTGMDWWRDGSSDTPAYKEGLFMNLECTYADTKAKSCINVERLSELGVTLDTGHYISYLSENGTIQKGFVDTDGFISKYELDDMESRAMFATLNHIGFIPQTYQDAISSYTTQVADDSTSYLVPKFKFIYPTDFDGRMNLIMSNYKNGFQQSMIDIQDEQYLTFRLGAEKNGTSRIRHFYKHDASAKKYEMPLYNNSFYFYFGINKGSTAIDKFNKMFTAECVKNEKHPFNLDIESKGVSYCPSMYNHNFGYGYIKITSDDIQTPYSYVLYDNMGTVVNSKEDMTATTFVIGGKMSEETLVIDENALSNQTYTLKITDFNGKTVKKRIVLETESLGAEYTTRRLGTKFYDINTTPKDYICNKNDEYYGVIDISSILIDSYSFSIKGCSSINTVEGNNTSYMGLNLICEYSTSSENIFTGDVTIHLEIRANNIEDADTSGISNCLCSGETSTETSIVETFKITEDGHLLINVYQPISYSISLTQMCGEEEITTNKGAFVVNVGNGDNFNTFLNGMPLKFMLGTNTDTIDAETANKSYFYSSNASTAVTNEIDGVYKLNKDVAGWFGVHEETTYAFGDTSRNTTKVEDINSWKDFFDLKNGIKSINTRTEILRYKFDKIFKLSDMVYVNDSSADSFKYTYIGGTEPILTRSFAPYYSNFNVMASVYINSENSSISVNKEYPNIVGYNYIGDSGTHRYTNDETSYMAIRFNGLWDNNPYSDLTTLGNYFAAFTKNGRYTSAISGKSSISIMALPNYAPVNPSGEWKRLGRDVQMSTLPIGVYNSGNYDVSGKRSQPYFRALTVDRSIGYDLEIWTGVYVGEIRISENSFNPNTSRIRGYIYGGIEMSYNEDYNIISADTNYDSDNIISDISANKRLEYSYSANSSVDGNAITIYNIPSYNGTQWVNRLDSMSNKVSGYLGDAMEALDNSGMPSNEEIERRLITQTPTEVLTLEEVRTINDNFSAVVTTFTSVISKSINIKDISILDFIAKTYGDSNFYFNTYIFGLFDYLYNILDYYNTSKYVSRSSQIDVNIEISVYGTTDRSFLDNVKFYVDYLKNTETWIKYAKDNFLSERRNYYLNGDMPKFRSNRQYLKTFYEVSFNDFDVRNLLWSSYNAKLLNDYTSEAYYLNKKDSSFYVFSHEQRETESKNYNISGNPQTVDNNVIRYNGDFNMKNISSHTRSEFTANVYSAYPTKRYIDIGNVPSSNPCSFKVSSCSYSTTPQINEDGSITSTISNGEIVDLEYTYGDVIEFVDGDKNRQDFSNISYINCRMRKSGSSAKGDFIKLVPVALSLSFKYKNFDTNGYNVITSYPKLVSVLGYCYGATYSSYSAMIHTTIVTTYYYQSGGYNNGIEYIRNVKDNIDSAINSKSMLCPNDYYFYFRNDSDNIWQMRNNYGIGKDVYDEPRCSAILEVYSMKAPVYFYDNADGNKPITADNDLYSVFHFRRDYIPIGETKVFAIMVSKQYSIENEMVNKKLISYETSSLIDIRPPLIRIYSGRTDNEGIQELFFEIKNECTYYRLYYTENEIEKNIACFKTREDAEFYKAKYEEKYGFTCFIEDNKINGPKQFWVVRDVTYDEYAMNPASTRLEDKSFNDYESAWSYAIQIPNKTFEIYQQNVDNGALNYSNQMYVNDGTMYKFVFYSGGIPKYEIYGEDVEETSSSQQSEIEIDESKTVRLSRKLKVRFTPEMGTIKENWNKSIWFTFYTIDNATNFIFYNERNATETFSANVDDNNFYWME